MNRAVKRLQERGDVRLPPGDEATRRHVFCFDSRDVVEVHTYKKDVGAGVWFRLEDGRVFDRCGHVSEFDPGLYRKGSDTGKTENGLD